MSDVRDLAEARARRAQKGGLPKRDPDFTVSAWIDGGRVEWIHGDFVRPGPIPDRAAALIDVAWLVQTDESNTAERPCFWWLLDTHGHSTFLTNVEVYRSPSWSRARWVARCWWTVTKRCARLAWLMARGK